MERVRGRETALSDNRRGRFVLAEQFGVVWHPACHTS